MFIPGETISHKFYIPFVRSDIDRIYVSYKQNDCLILKKTVYPGSVTREGVNSYFIVVLSQEESLLFQDDMGYTIQLNVIFTSGARCSSKDIKGVNGAQHLRERL